MASTAQNSLAADAGGELSIFQLVQAHQEKAARLPKIEEVRTVLDHSSRGILSAGAQKHPSSSTVEFACDAHGYPILAVSRLAVHTKDLLANPSCSLTVAKDPEDETDLVITLHGDAVSVSENEKEAIHDAYLSRHPNELKVDLGDLQYMRIEPKVVQYAHGNAAEGSGEFTKEEYCAAKVDSIYQFSKPISSHMNKDHAEDTKLIVQHSTSIQVDFAHMLDVDRLGFNVKAGSQGNTLKLRIPFARHARERKDVKILIIEMLRSAKTQAN